MSRWLKSVNNLLEDIDGDGTIGQLIEKGQQVAKSLHRDDSFDTDSQEEEYLDGEDEYGDDDDIDYEIGVTADEFNDGPFDDGNELGGEPSWKPAKSAEGEEPSDSVTQEEVDMFFRDAAETSDRQASVHVHAMSEWSGKETFENTNNESELKEGQWRTEKISYQSGRLDSSRKRIVGTTDSVSAVIAKPSSKGEPRDIDVSPRPPRRYADADRIENEVTATQLDMEVDSDGAFSCHRSSPNSSTPPKLPTRQPAIALSKSQPVPFVQQSALDTKYNHKSQLVTNSEVRKLTAKLQSMEEKLTKTSKELKASRAETKRLEKQVAAFDSQLEAANSEIHAQSEELRRAGERMEKDRRVAQEEREELLDDQDEEIEQLKALHTSEVEALKAHYEKQLTDISNQLESEVARRAQEGGNWNKEFDDVVKRERLALKNLSDANMKTSNLEFSLSKLEAKVHELESKLESATLCTKEAEARQQEAEDKLDEALAQHVRQLSQRQNREAELEKTIFDLGSALTEAKRLQQSSMIHSIETHPGDGTDFKEKYEGAIEELETIRVQLNMETQRRTALENELNEISRERSEEISTAQEKQLQHDRKVADLETNIAQLKASLHTLKVAGSESILEENHKKDVVLNAEIKEARNEIAKLSDQLMRHQGIAESSKSEILALKGRLQSATSRAEAAERSLLSVQSSPEYLARRNFHVESAGFSSSRRRVKGARSRPISVGRTIRASINLDNGALGNTLEKVVSTIDALDKWMVDTGGLMRSEPLARLGFLVYLVTLHLWTFGLVIFHTVETPHGDFGNMDANPRHWRNHN